MPVPDTDCKIVDLEDADRVLGQGERGELCVQGPQVMLGYWNRPEETALAIRNGWLHTGRRRGDGRGRATSGSSTGSRR